MPTPGDLFGGPKCPIPEVAVRESSDGTNPDDTVASADVLDYTRDDVPAEKLQHLGALDENGELTEIGRQMEQFADESPEHARMLVEAKRYPETVRTQVAAIVALQKVSLGLVLYGSKKRPCEERWRGLINSRYNDSDWLKQLEVLVSIQNMSKEELTERDIRPGVPGRIKREICHLKTRQGSDEYDLTLPTEEERKQIVECIIAGSVDKLWHQVKIGDLVPSCNCRSEVFGVDTYSLVDIDKGRLYRNNKGEERKRSRRSLIKMGQLVVADPEDICFRQNGEEVEIPVLKGITNVELSDLREVAPQLFTSEDRGFAVNDDGRPAKLVRSVLDNGLLQLGEQLVSAESSEEMADFIVKYIAENNSWEIVGKANDHLTNLNKKSGQLFERFSDQDLEMRIAEHLAKVGLMDENGELRKISDIVAGVTKFTASESCGQEVIREIEDLYPDYITIGDNKLGICYRRDKDYTGPYFSHRTVDIDNILDVYPEDIAIPGGQQIMCEVRAYVWVGEESWPVYKIVSPEELREKARENRAERQRQQEAESRERAFYEKVNDAVAKMESFGNQLPVELQKQRLELTIDLRYVDYDDEGSAEQLTALIEKADLWCSSCDKGQPL